MAVALLASKDAKRGTTISDAPTVPAPTALEISLVPNAVNPAVSTFFTLSAKTSFSGITLSGKFSTTQLAAILGSKPVAAPLPKFYELSYVDVKVRFPQKTQTVHPVVTFTVPDCV